MLKLNVWRGKVRRLPCIAIILLVLTGLSSDRAAGDDDPLLAMLKESQETAYLQTGDNELDRMEWKSDQIVEYLKYSDGLEILGNRVTVYLDEAGDVIRIYDDSTANMKLGPRLPLISSAQAKKIAEFNLSKMAAASSIAKLVWFRKADQGILAWHVETELAPCEEPCAPTHVLCALDAMNGDILSQTQRGGNLPELDPTTGQLLVPECRGPSPIPIIANETFHGPTEAQEYGLQFPAVCRINGNCSGTLITSDVVLSARHCNSSPGDLIQFGHDSNNSTFSTTILSVNLPDGPGMTFDGGDVSILTLNDSVPSNVANPRKLTAQTTSLFGRSFQVAGYGRQGVGSTGDNPPMSNGFRWAGENVLDPRFLGNLFRGDFDNGTAAANTANTGGVISSQIPMFREVTTAPGDSGGPMLFELGGEGLIAAVLSGCSGPQCDNRYGDTITHTGIANFQTQIEAAGGVFSSATPPTNFQWNNTSSANAWFDSPENWAPLGNPQPNHEILFHKPGETYEVWWSPASPGRTVEEVVVVDNNVTFRNILDDATRYKLTVNGLFEVDQQGVLNLEGIEFSSEIAFVSEGATLNVDGSANAGSSFETSDQLYVDDGGIVNISNGGIVTTGSYGGVGNFTLDPGTVSAANVIGTGSQWNIAGQLQLGTQGQETYVNVLAGGTINSNGGIINEADDARVSIDGPNSQWTSTGTITNGSEVYLINGSSLIAQAGIQNGGTITVTGGNTSTITGNITSSSADSRVITSLGSELLINGDVDIPQLVCFGTTRIEGSLAVEIVNTESPVTGLLELAGDFRPFGDETGEVLMPGVSLQMEASTNTFIQVESHSSSGIDSIDVHDFVDAAPDVTLGGNLHVKLIDGFQLAADQCWRIVDLNFSSGTLSGVFANAPADGDVVLTNNGFNLVIRYETSRVYLETEVPTAPPANDDWANSINIANGSFPVTVMGTSLLATTQADEQELGNTGATVWWFITPPEDGTFVIDTFGSDFDTQLHIYQYPITGNFADLLPLENNDDADPGQILQSEVVLQAVAGECYEIRVGGFTNGSPAAQGSITLNVDFVPDAGDIPGDVNCDGVVNLLDVQPFINAISDGAYNSKADVNLDGADNLLDVAPFVALLSGG